MSPLAKLLIKGTAVSMHTPGLSRELARLRKNGHRIIYFVRLKDDRFQYLVRVRA